MEEDSTIRKLAGEQRRRMLGAILGYLEEHVYPGLSASQRTELRTKVVGSVNVYHDFVLDVIKVNRDDVVRSDEAVRLIRQLHDSQTRIERSLVGSG